MSNPGICVTVFHLNIFTYLLNVLTHTHINSCLKTGANYCKLATVGCLETTTTNVPTLIMNQDIINISGG